MSDYQQTGTGQDAEQQEIRFGWGEALREERVRQGMSVKDISDHLHFEVRLIENIESEILGNLPPASFVRGYLRNYARMLEIDPEPIVEAFNQVCGEEASVITQSPRVKEVPSATMLSDYITWLVAIIIVVVLAVWWWSEISAPPEVVLEQNGSVLPETTPPARIESDLIAEPEPEIESAFEPALEEDPEIDAMSPVEEEPLLATLVLSFEQDSWVEVTDAKGRRLYVNIARAGQRLRLEGEPPLQLLLGNAPAVTVEYNGEIYRRTEHNSKGVARFSLGE